jgi:hypothetical protein
MSERALARRSLLLHAISHMSDQSRRHTAARGAGVLISLIGCVHLIVGVMEYDHYGLNFLWFEGSGIALVLMGALTLLSASTRSWPALNVTAFSANVLGLALGVVFCILTRATQPQGLILVALFAFSALVSGLRLRTR